MSWPVIRKKTVNTNAAAGSGPPPAPTEPPGWQGNWNGPAYNQWTPGWAGSRSGVQVNTTIGCTPGWLFINCFRKLQHMDMFLFCTYLIHALHVFINCSIDCFIFHCCTPVNLFWYNITQLTHGELLSWLTIHVFMVSFNVNRQSTQVCDKKS